jgi:glutathione S-transferase
LLTLWHAWNCPFCQRVRIVLAEKDLPWQDREIDLARKPPEVLALNPPTGGVPIAVDDGAVVPESLVLMQYLDERYPERPLAPRDAVGRARMRLLFERAGELAAGVGKVLRGGPAQREPGEAQVKAALAALEPHVPADGFLLGPFGLADAAFAPFLRRLPEHLSAQALALPRLAAWRERLLARPSVATHTAPR